MAVAELTVREWNDPLPAILIGTHPIGKMRIVILSTPTRIRLEKAAADTGFDDPRPPVDQWLAFASSQAPLQIWLTITDDNRCVSALSQAHVARALDDH